MFRFVDDISSWPVISGLVVLMIICLLLFWFRRELVCKSFPDLWRHWYTPEHVRDFLCQLGSQKRKWYAISELTVDVVFPICYGSLAMISIAALIGDAALWQWLLFLPLITVSADLLENFSVAYLAFSFEESAPAQPLAYFTATSSFVKWKSLYLVVLVLVLLGLSWLF